MCRCFIARLAAAALLACVGAGAGESRATSFLIWPQAPGPADTIVLRVYGDDPAPAGPLAPHLRVTPLDEAFPVERVLLAGSHVLDGAGRIRVAFSIQLPVGRHAVRYYDLPPTEPAGEPRGQAEIVVTATGPIQVAEYVHPGTGHYFLTADPDEMRKLDDGTIAGWLRTGQSFHAVTALASLGVRPVCRLYGQPAAGLDTHLFSDRRAECDGVLARWPEWWTKESDVAFNLPVDYAYGCDTDEYLPLYRLFNNRPDVNHRYTTSPSIRDQMVADGWIVEGADYGALGIVWSCTLR